MYNFFYRPLNITILGSLSDEISELSISSDDTMNIEDLSFHGINAFFYIIDCHIILDTFEFARAFELYYKLKLLAFRKKIDKKMFTRHKKSQIKFHVVKLLLKSDFLN